MERPQTHQGLTPSSPSGKTRSGMNVCCTVSKAPQFSMHQAERSESGLCWWFLVCKSYTATPRNFIRERKTKLPLLQSYNKARKEKELIWYTYVHILIKDNKNNYTLGKGEDRSSEYQEVYKNSGERHQNLNKKGCNYSPPPTSAESGRGQESQQEKVNVTGG